MLRNRVLNSYGWLICSIFKNAIKKSLLHARVTNVLIINVFGYSHSISDIICIRLRFKLLHYWLGSLVTFTGDKKSDTYSLVSV